MVDTLQISPVCQASGYQWDACMAIYRASFPEWEREPEAVIAKRVNSGSYQLVAGLLDRHVVGFYIQEFNSSHGYVMFNYLAVDKSQRGRGLGIRLCRDAIARFQNLSGFSLLLIEAEERQATFYGHLGFFKLQIDYSVPRYDDGQSMPMHLMALPWGPIPAAIPADELTAIIRHLYINGYLLSQDDPRIEYQLSRIDGDVPLISWPQEK